jgi:transcriptional regulator with XRE-family HTH domain
MGLDSPAERLRWARQQHGQYKTPTDAARAFGWTVSTYLGHENGDRQPSREAAKRYARGYRVRWEWLLDKEGPPTVARAPARIIGAVVGATLVRLYPDPKNLDAAETPPGSVATTSALEVTGGSMRGIADDGWLVFFDDERKAPTPALIGKLCVIQLKSGEIYIRVLHPGRKKGHYDLESATDPTLRDQKVEWASRVSWIKPR